MFELDERTTSNVEAIHAVYQKQFPKRANIFDFVENLRQFEFTATDNAEKLIENHKPKMKRDKDIIRSQKIKNLSDQLKCRKITFEKFLYEMSREDSNEDEYFDESYDEEDGGDDKDEEINDSSNEETDIE